MFYMFVRFMYLINVLLGSSIHIMILIITINLIFFVWLIY